MTASPKAVASSGTCNRMPRVDKKVHENREEHKPEIPLGQNSAVQNGTVKNGQAVSGRNKRDVHGGASRDRKARYSENKQVINSSRILQCPEGLKTPAMPN